MSDEIGVVTYVLGTDEHVTRAVKQRRCAWRITGENLCLERQHDEISFLPSAYHPHMTVKIQK